MTENCVSMNGDVFINLLPLAFVIPDFFTFGTDG